MVRNDSVIKLLSDLVAIDSQSYKGNVAIIAFLSDLFKDYEQTHQPWVRDQDDVKGENLIVKIPGNSAEHCLVFVCHMDTVPTSSAWETDPFILEESGGNLYGLGACDTKGGVAALIEAIFSLSEKPAYDTYVVFDGDEEVAFTGARKYKNHFSLKNPVFIAIEPTDQQICIAARTSLSFTVTTYGKSQHASYATPEVNNADSAIFKMAKIMDMLIQDAQRLSSEKDPLMGTNVQNLGVIQGGTAGNVIPDRCELSISRRLLLTREIPAEIERLTQLIHEVDTTATFTVKMGEKGFLSSENSPLAKITLHSMQQYFPQTKFVCFQAMSEVSMFQDRGDVVVLGPGSISLAHKANEYINAQELFQFITVYQKIMQEIKL